MGKGWEGDGFGQSPTPVLTQDIELAQRTGLLEQQPGVHTVPVEFMLARQHPQPLQGMEEGQSPQATGSGQGEVKPCEACSPTPILLSVALVGSCDKQVLRSLGSRAAQVMHLLVAEVVQAHSAGVGARPW